MTAISEVELESTVELFVTYLTKAKKKHGGKLNSELGQEALQRLRQISWLLRRIHLICKRLRESPLSSKDFLMPIEAPRKMESISNEGELLDQGFFIVRAYTESFYYLAFRLRHILQNGMPGLSGFECKGVRNVRNHLIEHPEKSKVLLQTFDLGLTSGKGPRLKVDPAQKKVEHVDIGLFVNALEYKTSLETALNKAIANLT